MLAFEVYDENGYVVASFTDSFYHTNNLINYTLEWDTEGNNPGKYTVTVTFKGKYSGTKKLTLTISKDGTYKKVNSYKANKLSGSKSKLKSGKKYYFKVRAYKKTSSGTVYSSWSSIKSVKIK